MKSRQKFLPDPTTREHRKLIAAKTTPFGYEVQRLLFGRATSISEFELQATEKTVRCDLTAIHYLYSMPRGYRSRHRDTHEIMLSVLYLGLGSRVWLQYCILLNSVLKLVCVWIDVTWFISCPGSIRRVAEDHSVVGSGPVPYILLARLSICL